MPTVLSLPARLVSGVDSFSMLFSQYNPNLQKIDDFLVVVGLLFVGKFVLSTSWDLCVGLRAMLWARLWKPNFTKRYGGKWAVVTGCTDGIGKAYAHELAKDGLNLILISRSMEKLRNVSNEIESKHSVETFIIQADFMEGTSLYPKIDAQLQGKDICILVNNVGMMATPQYFWELSEKELQGHITVNVEATVRMTRLILPQMRQRKNGVIVNICSIIKRGPVPLAVLYAASKTFVEFFSVGLQWELYNSGVTVQTVSPGLVSTPLTAYSEEIHREGLFNPSPAKFAASAVPSIGYTNYTSGYWAHGLQTYFTDRIPRWISSAAGYGVFYRYGYKGPHNK